MQKYSFIIPDNLDGVRLDKALSLLIGEISRSRIQELIKQNNVLVNNQSGKWGSSKVRAGMSIIVNVPEPENLELVPQDIPLDIVYEDEHLLVINKEAGMVVHPASGNLTGTVVNAVLHHCGDSLLGIGGVKRPGIVHRIDKDTSGLLVIAKTDDSTTLYQNCLKHAISIECIMHLFGVFQIQGMVKLTPLLVVTKPIVKKWLY